MRLVAARQPRSRVAALVVGLTLVAAGTTACGGSSSDDTSAKQAIELQQAREQGRKDAQNEARSKKLAADAAALRKEVAELRKSDKAKGSGRKDSSGGGAGTSASVKPAATSEASTGSTKSCGGGITVNSVTSCAFAKSVQAEYYSSGGSSSISAYIPTTGQTYSLNCSGGSATTCSGGNGAQVTFP